MALRAVVGLSRSDHNSHHAVRDLESSFSEAWRQLIGGDLDDYLDACEFIAPVGAESRQA